jgi:hypothetical protein
LLAEVILDSSQPIEDRCFLVLPLHGFPHDMAKL